MGVSGRDPAYFSIQGGRSRIERPTASLPQPVEPAETPENWRGAGLLLVLALSVILLAYEPALCVACLGAWIWWWLSDDPFPQAGVFVPFVRALFIGGILGPVAFWAAKTWLGTTADVACAVASLKNLDAVAREANQLLNELDDALYYWLILFATALAVSLWLEIRGLLASVRLLKEAILVVLLAFSTFMSFSVERVAAAQHATAAAEERLEQHRRENAVLAAERRRLLDELRLAVTQVAEQTTVLAAVTAFVETISQQDVDLKPVEQELRAFHANLGNAAVPAYAQLPLSVRQLMPFALFSELEDRDRAARVREQLRYARGTAAPTAAGTAIGPRELPADIPALQIIDLELTQEIDADPSPEQMAAAREQLARGKAALQALKETQVQLSAKSASTFEALDMAIRETVPSLGGSGLADLLGETARSVIGEFVGTLLTTAIRDAGNGRLEQVVALARQRAARYVVVLRERSVGRIREWRSRLDEVAAAHAVFEPIALPAGVGPLLAERDGRLTVSSDPAAYRRVFGKAFTDDLLLAWIRPKQYPEPVQSEIRRAREEGMKLAAVAPSAAAARALENWAVLRQTPAAQPWDGGIRRAELTRRYYAATYFHTATPEAYMAWAQAQENRFQAEERRIEGLHALLGKVSRVQWQEYERIRYREVHMREAQARLAGRARAL